MAGLGPLRPNDIANISEVTRPGIHGIHDTGLLPGAPSGAQLGLPQQIVGLGGGRERPGWTGQPIKNTGYVPAPGTEGDRGLAMQAGMNLLGTRATDLRNTRETPGAAMTQADFAGLGALRGPTQQKIQQGLGSFSQGAGI